MSDDRISKLAEELDREGEHVVAAILSFVSALRHLEDRTGLVILTCFAEKLCARKLRKSDRQAQEQIAIAEMMRNL